MSFRAYSHLSFKVTENTKIGHFVYSYFSLNIVTFLQQNLLFLMLIRKIVMSKSA